MLLFFVCKPFWNLKFEFDPLKAAVVWGVKRIVAFQMTLLKSTVQNSPEIK